MIPGCTSALDVELDDVYVTINQNGTVSQFADDQLDINPNGYAFTLYLSQADTLKFRYGPAVAQVNWTKDDGSGNIYRGATDPFTIHMGQQFYRKVLE